ncbi:hypothetical protein [Desulfovibrio psychrotolerans]|nr:hypothetical protein [Desulfovibrio psychrotolerans]
MQEQPDMLHNAGENTMKHRHTYLVMPGVWSAKGNFTDGNGTQHAVSGTSTITHDRGIWYNRAAMLIHTVPPSDMECVYEIAPMMPGSNHTTWTAETLPMGRMSGNFAMVGNTILACAYTPQGTSMETMRQIDADTYENRGALFMDGILISAWETVLHRQQPQSDGR